MNKKIGNKLATGAVAVCMAFGSAGCEVANFCNDIFTIPSHHHVVEKEQSFEQKTDEDESFSAVELPPIFEEQEGPAYADDTASKTSEADDTTSKEHVVEKEPEASTKQERIDDKQTPQTQKNVYQKNEFLPAGYFNEHPIVVGVSYDFSDEEFAIIEYASAKLDICATGIKFEIIRTNDRKIQNLSENQRIIIIKETQERMTNKQTGIAGLGSASYPTNNRTRQEDYRGLIRISEAADIKYYEIILMHEYGHILGLLHENDEESIMYPHINDKMSLTEKNIEALNYLYPAAEESEECQEEMELERY